MKLRSKLFAAALAVECALAASGPAQAQSIMLSGVDVSATSGYGGWVAANFSSGSSVGSAGTGGIEVTSSTSGGFGGAYIDFGSTPLTVNADSTQATLTFTVNGTASNYVWMGAPLSLNDGHTVDYGGIYSGYNNSGNQAGAVWNGITASITFALTGAQLTAVQAGGDVIYGMSIGIDPSVITGGNIDITFNSLTLSPSPTPEPAPLALSGLSIAGLLIFRRRK